MNNHPEVEGGSVEDNYQGMENIKLDYPVIIKWGVYAFYANNGCEVFNDEHFVQWVKFTPRNGDHRGKEHMVRTDQVMIIRGR